ncbi:hypothetical protein Tco_1012665, partial [Tanacetum coccineum]
NPTHEYTALHGAVVVDYVETSARGVCRGDDDDEGGGGVGKASGSREGD